MIVLLVNDSEVQFFAARKCFLSLCGFCRVGSNTTSMLMILADFSLLHLNIVEAGTSCGCWDMRLTLFVVSNPQD